MKTIPTGDELEALFHEGKMLRLGMGSRRTCYKIPGTKLCVKCYRSEDEIEEGKYDGEVALSSSVVREIRKGRFDSKRNTSCQEYRYWTRLKKNLPPEVFAVFPQTLECVSVPSRGWCIAEERVENYDGSEPESFKSAYRVADGCGRKKLLAAFSRLIEQFRIHAVRFYDPQNLLVQKISADDFVLRIVDFEPATRSVLSFDSLHPFFVRRKMLRRVKRWLKAQLGAELPRIHGSGNAQEPISMSFSVSDNYSQHLAVVLTSILENNPESDFVFHVLHRNITDENQKRIHELEQVYFNCEIRFHAVDNSLFEDLTIPKELEHITKETYFRYILADILSEEKRTIYSDVDVLCVGDLRPLWNIDLKGRVIGAVSEGLDGEYKKKLLGLTGDAPYFNAGMLVMDLDVMRAESSSVRLMKNTIEYAGRIAWADQDIINITFRNRILELENIWNCFTRVAGEVKQRVVIHHFANASQKPWCNIWKNYSWPLYLKYLRLSPYQENAFRFVWGHIKGFFFFKYTKKRVTRYLVCGIRVWRKKAV